MKKAILPIIAIIVVLAIVGGSSYNGLVTMRQSVDGSWAQVENQLQRRADLIPNLVNTVKGYAGHEEKVLTDITKARAGIDSAKNQEDYQAANAELDRALNNLNIVVESYPDLKANENFMNLQSQLEGTENRIATERMRFNELVTEYNTKVSRFPTNIMAKMFGFEKRDYFQVLRK